MTAALATDVFDLALTLGPAVARDLARPPKTSPPPRPPKKPINMKPIRSVHKPPVGPGKEPTPGSAVVADYPTRESTGVVAGAGVDVPAVRARDDGRADGAVSAATFPLPLPLGPPRFGGDDNPGKPKPHPYPPPRLGAGPLYDVLPGWSS